MSMKVGLATLAVAAITLILVLAGTTSVSALVCYISTESDPADGGRTCFVLTPGHDPCSCSEVMLGGHNPRPIPGPNPTVYLDKLPALSVKGVRSVLGCPMEDDSPQEMTQVPTVPGPVLSTAAPQPPTDCQAILDAGQTTSGVYTIQLAGQDLQVYCRMESGNGYIVLQRRQDGSVSFDRTWQEYTEGFGDLTGEFWLGNQKLRDFTDHSSETWELVITMTSFENQTARARYGEFSVSGDEYALDVDAYDGHEQAGDSLIDTHQKFFTTRDRDNDNSGGKNCAEEFLGGWWYKKCNYLQSNLNGEYGHSPAVQEYMGIQWTSWKGSQYSLKSCEMKMRRVPVTPSN